MINGFNFKIVLLLNLIIIANFSRLQIMKNLILVFFFLVGSNYVAKSQILISLIFGDKLNSEKLEFGLTVGSATSTIINLDNAKYTSKLNLGFFFNIKIAQKYWFFHTGVGVKSTYGAKKLNVYDLGSPELNTSFEEATVNREFGIFNVPALIRCQTEKGWGLELGPQFSLRTKVDDIFTVDYENTRDKLFFRNDVSDLYKRITVEGAVGVYKKLRKGEGITLNFRYVISLYDIQKEHPEVAQYHSVFKFLVGIPIGKEKKPKEPKEKKKKAKKED